MSRTLAVTRADGRLTETEITGGRLRVPAEGGASYRLVDPDHPTQRHQATMKRVNDDLVIQLIDDGTELVIQHWFFVCDVDYRGCSIELETLGGAAGETLQPRAGSAVAATAATGLIWWSPTPSAAVSGGSTTAKDADSKAAGNAALDDTNNATNWKPVLAGVGGLLVLGAAAGGGSGGDAGEPAATATPTAPVAAPVAGSGGATASAIRPASVTGAASDANAPSGVTVSGPVPSSGIGPGPLANGAWSNDTSPSLTGTLEAPLATGDRVQVLRDGAVVGQATVSDLTWRFTDSNVPAGEHRYTAQVVNAAGQASTPGTPWLLVIDGTPPAAPQIDAVTGDNLIAPAERAAGIAVTGSAEAGTTITLLWGELQQSGVVDASGHYAIRLPVGGSGLPGDTTISVVATDSFGNQSAATEQVVGLFNPTVAITGGVDDVPRTTGSFASGARINDDTPTLVGRLGQTLAAGESVQILRNGVAVGQATVDGLQWQFDDGTLRDGNYTITARIVGRDGTVVASSEQPFTFVLDSAAPDTPTIATVAGNNRISAGEALAGVDVTGGADAGETIEVSWGTTRLTTTADRNGDWSVHFTGLPVGAGSSVISAFAVDAAGNASAARTRAVTVDANVMNLSVASIDDTSAAASPLAEKASVGITSAVTASTGATSTEQAPVEKASAANAAATPSTETVLLRADLLDDHPASIAGLPADGATASTLALSDAGPAGSSTAGSSATGATVTAAPLYALESVSGSGSLNPVLFDPNALHGGPSGGY